jgi:bile acid-coenzyme A ligase
MADADPSRPAITAGDAVRTRLELDVRTNRLARAYAGMGVSEGDFVTLAFGNGIAFYESCFALWKLGATPQPVSPRLPRRELEAIVELARPRLVVGLEDDIAGHITLPASFEPDESVSDAPLLDRVSRSWKAPTSGGSTGRPKIIVDGRPSLFEPDERPLYLMQRDGVQLVAGPLYHNAPFALSMYGLLHGNHIVVMDRFDPEQTLELLDHHEVDWVFLVPTMMHRIWRLPPRTRERADLSSLRILLHGAAPCPEWLKAAWIDWLGPKRVHELYSGTESQTSTWITGTQWLEHRGSVGRAVGGGSIVVLDDEGSVAPSGQIGEIWMRPPDGADATYRYIGAVARERGGWESLGDIGWTDDDGYLYIADRRADMILVGGENVYPAEVEAALDEHPTVRSCAVVGVPDPDLGERVHAVIELDGDVTDEELLAFLGDRLVRYKLPRTFERVSEPVRDDAGKVRRSALRPDHQPGDARASG